MEPEAKSISLNNYTFQNLLNNIPNILHDLPKRVYSCRICDIRFARKEDVIEHEKIHAIKLFECLDCKKNFRHMLALKEHFYSSHDEIVKYMCRICSKTYTRYANYYKHSKKHALYKCFNCDEKFFDYATLDEHFLLVHPHEKVQYVKKAQ